MPETPVDTITAGLPGGIGGRRHIVVTHASGWTERQMGSLVDAGELANSHGLAMVPTMDNTSRWEATRPGKGNSPEMPERQIAGIVWHRLGHHIDVIYVEGHPDRLEGSQLFAAELAEKAGLHVVPTSEGMVRWVRDAGTWRTV